MDSRLQGRPGTHNRGSTDRPRRIGPRLRGDDKKRLLQLRLAFAIFLGEFDLVLERGCFFLAAAINHVDLFGAEPVRGSHNVDGGISSADDCDCRRLAKLAPTAGAAVILELALAVERARQARTQERATWP